MQRRKFSREFKIEAVKLVRERRVSVAQAGRDLDDRCGAARVLYQLNADFAGPQLHLPGK